MRELTVLDVNAELAEQLPARELMGHPTGDCGCRSSFTYNQGSYDGNGNSNFGLIAVQVAGVGDGNNISL